MLDKLQMSINKSNLTKLLINKYNSFQFARLKDERINQKNYWYAIENIMYIVIYICLNIAFVIERLS